MRTNGAVGGVVGQGLKETLSVAVAEVKDSAVNWDAYWLVSQTVSQARAHIADWAVNRVISQRGGPLHPGLGLYLKGVAR